MLYFRKFPIAKSLWIRVRGGGGIKHFPSQIFCLVVPKFIVGESLNIALISGFEKS